MDAFQSLDQRWTLPFVVFGVLLVVLGVVIRVLSAKRSFAWRIGDAALYLGTVFLGIAVVLHFVVPFVVVFATRSFSGR
jgi:hypothetical protein